MYLCIDAYCVWASLGDAFIDFHKLSLFFYLAYCIHILMIFEILQALIKLILIAY